MATDTGQDIEVQEPEIVDTQTISITGLDEPVVVGTGGYVSYKAEEAPDFNQELRNEVLDDFNHRCMICGAGGVNAQNKLDVIHVMKHRGQGSLQSVNHKSNLGVACRECHNKHHNGIISFQKFDPNDRKDGLIVEDENGDVIPKSKLYFYRLPTNELIQQAWKEKTEFDKELEESIEHKWNAVEHLKNLKYKVVDDRPLFMGVNRDNATEEYYQDWQVFYQEQVRGKLFENPKSLPTINQYISDAKALPKLGDGWKEVQFGAANNLASAIRDDDFDEEDLQELKTVAIEEQPKKVRDVKRRIRGDKGISAIASCSRCKNNDTLNPKKHNMSTGSKKVDVCYQFNQPRLLSSFTAEEKRKTAENCPHYDEYENH